MEKNTIKILLANDHNLLRSGIILAFEKLAPHIQVVREAVTFEELLEVLPTTEFDILLTDDRMQRKDLLTYLPIIKKQYPDIKILIHSIFMEEAPHIKEALEFAKGWVSFSSNEQEYVEAVETVYNGEHYYFKGLNE